MYANAARNDRFINLHSEHTPVLSRWSYHPEEPFSITVAFQTGVDQWVEWVFARDLLMAGVVGPAGIGDVRFIPFDDGDERLLLLQIESDQGRASWFLDRREAEEFLEVTLEEVPAGSEEQYFDVDKLIEEIADV
ncbi:SsgA family sporulation/cell division regulator [Haloechinothrix sp. YIM 98757]|uniref:SsgA family sporulation/cell division regulator n=1 Tax=Haloechinothrix aidingensis TaxID=2752311 RepID=A0A838A8E4_9PSEU|nr:SsgA family sporulation/cell division regulator [Haloechinothrix aidingensis]MBA0124709.1 SsgA family sporulation/cell division regulator [Haloechinothrix aidingensis]